MLEINIWLVLCVDVGERVVRLEFVEAVLDDVAHVLEIVSLVNENGYTPRILRTLLEVDVRIVLCVDVGEWVVRLEFVGTVLYNVALRGGNLEVRKGERRVAS